jgi:hypothetical protein
MPDRGHQRKRTVIEHGDHSLGKRRRPGLIPRFNSHDNSLASLRSTHPPDRVMAVFRPVNNPSAFADPVNADASVL